MNIGAVLPLTGPLAGVGAQAKIGLDLAAAEINADGGIFGAPVEIAYGDSRTDPATAADHARDMIAKGVTAIVGPVSSASRDAMAPVMAEHKTPLLYATDYEGGHNGPELFFFNTVPEQSAFPLLRYLHGTMLGRPRRQETGPPCYALLGADYVWPRTTFKLLRAEIETFGASVVSEQFVPLAADQDYGAAIAQIEAAGADILLLALDDPAFVRQAGAGGLPLRVTVGYLADPAPCMAALGPGEGDGMFACVPFVASDPAPGVQDFVARVRKMQGDDVTCSAYVMTHYNALMALRAGLTRSGEIGRAAAVAGLTGLDFETPTGTSTIGADHHVVLDMYIAMTGRGTVHVINPLGPIAADD